MMLGLLRSIELKTVKGLELDSPGDDMGQRSKGLAPHDVWPICGQNSQHITAYCVVKNGNGCKILKIPWWLQLSKRQILTFLPRLSFGTVRSEVRILSP
jgi:hypothetical protein